MLQAVGAERAALSIFLKKPDSLLEVDDVLDEADFTNSGARIIYSLIKGLVLEDKNVQLDHYTLVSRAEEKGLKDFIALTQNGELLEALEATKDSVNPATLGKHIVAIKTASLKRNTIGVLDTLKDEVEDFTGLPVDLKNLVEDKVFNAMRSMDMKDEEIQSLPDSFEETINAYADFNQVLGLDVGLPRFQRDCGGVRNGTVTGLFARAKAGKSQFAAHCAVQVAVKQKIPVLYLDTELQLRNQQMRTCGIISGVPYEKIENGSWKANKDDVAKIKEAFKVIKAAPFYYKNIAGKSVNHVIPVIRKFVHKYVGESKGEVPRCLVIYDYIKLMAMEDLKAAQEYQVLGFFLSALHDVAAKLNIPVIALGQLNREAFKVDNESTVAGSDRITHNLDSLTIMRVKKPEEVETDGTQRGNYIFKIPLARNGPAHDFDEWINVHFDKSAGQFKEDKRNSEIREALGNRVSDRNANIADEDTSPFGDIREAE